MVGAMCKNKLPGNNSDMEKKEELHQIENWIEELSGFGEKGYTPFSYEDLLRFVENAKKIMNL